MFYEDTVTEKTDITSYQYSFSVHTLSKLRVIVTTAAHILIGRSEKVAANGGTYTIALMHSYTQSHPPKSAQNTAHTFSCNY
jgi:hypothetical protein